MKQQTAVEWYFDKIKSHFEHDGDLFEVSYMTYTIAKEKEKEQMRKIYEGLAQNLGHTWIKESDLPTFEEFYQRTYGKKQDDLNQISNIPLGSVIGKKPIPRNKSNR